MRTSDCGRSGISEECRHHLLLGLLALLGLFGLTNSSRAADRAYLFTSFRKNGEDGLHLAWSTNGYQWTALKQDQSFLAPKVGGKLMRDPSMARGRDGTFHMVWTTAWNQHGMGYASSKDLVHWSEQRLLDVMAHEPQTRNVWAPDLCFDDRSGQFLIVWASTIPGRFPDTEQAGDDKYNHRLYATTTRDWATFTPTKLFYEPGFNCIDATVVGDGDRFLMVLKDETRTPPAKNLRVATGAALAGPYGKPSAPITGKFWAEGPSMVRIDGRWFVYFDRYTEHRYGLVTSENLEQWRDESAAVTFPRDHRHGSVFEVDRSVLDRLLKEPPARTDAP